MRQLFDALSADPALDGTLFQPFAGLSSRTQ